MDALQGIDKVIALVGSERKLAKLLGVPRKAVYYWKLHRVPAERVPGIVEACTNLPPEARHTRARIRRKDLRPDLW